MTEKPYKTLEEFELWLFEERQRLMVAQNADLIRLIKSEKMLSRVVWSPDAECIGNSSILGIDLKAHPHSRAHWDTQVTHQIAGDELLLPITTAAEQPRYMKLRWQPQSPILTIPADALEAAAEEYDLRFNLAFWDRLIEDAQGKLDTHRARRESLAKVFGNRIDNSEPA